MKKITLNFPSKGAYVLTVADDELARFLDWLDCTGLGYAVENHYETIHISGIVPDTKTLWDLFGEDVEKP